MLLSKWTKRGVDQMGNQNIHKKMKTLKCKYWGHSKNPYKRKIYSDTDLPWEKWESSNKQSTHTSKGIRKRTKKV